jgi:hypothetical protein
MSEVFDAYLDELTFFSTDIRNNIVVLKSGENFASVSKTIETVFEQANEVVKQAEVEARSFESKERKYLNERLKFHKETLASLRSDYDSEIYQTQRSQLVGKSGEDRGRMLEQNEK